MIETLIYLASLTSFVFDTKWCQDDTERLWHYTRIHTDDIIHSDYIWLCIENMKSMWLYNSNVLLYTIAHELWHLYWHRFMTQEERAEWIELSKQSSGNDFYRTWRNNSIYTEDFAEMFASLYVPFYNDVLRIRTPLFREKQAFIKNWLKMRYF